MIVFLLFFFLFLSSCVHVRSLVESLNERKVTSCITFTGAAWMFMGVHGVTATGGATIPDCLYIR